MDKKLLKGLTELQLHWAKIHGNNYSHAQFRIFLLF